MSWAGLLLASLPAVGAAEVVQRIEWEAVEGCPSQAAVVEALAGSLGRRLAEFPRAVLAHARVEASTGGYHLHLRIEVDGVNERHELSATTCDQLGWDAALLIATAVDPFAMGPREPRPRQLLLTPVPVQRPRSRPEPPRAVVVDHPREPVPTDQPRQFVEPAEPLLAPARPPEPVAVAAITPVDRARTRSGGGGSLAVAGTTFAGLFPQIGGGVEVEGGVDRGLFRWQLGASGWFGGSFRALNTDVGADLWAASGSTGACVVPSIRRARFASCAVVGAGAVTASSINTTGPRSLARPWVHAGADLRVVWSPRPRVGMFFGLAVLPALVRPAWVVRSPDASFRVPPVVGLLRLGVELRGLGAG
jgi:hypothetical protein